jgi:hypothetical protein
VGSGSSSQPNGGDSGVNQNNAGGGSSSCSIASGLVWGSAWIGLMMLLGCVFVCARRRGRRTPSE